MGVHSVVHTPKHTIRQQAAAVTLQKKTHQNTKSIPQDEHLSLLPDYGHTLSVFLVDETPGVSLEIIIFFLLPHA